jgi:cyclic-di-AMP phosphodiesterase PgpH
MRTPAERSLQLHRLIAVLLVVAGVPLVIALGTVADEQPVREGEPSPRTVFADDEVRIVDEQATEQGRRVAAESVEPVEVFDREAQSAIVRDIREVFTATREVRTPPEGGDLEPDPGPPSAVEQIDGLQDLEPDLADDVATALVGLSDDDLDVVERETIAIAQELARQRVSSEQLEGRIETDLPVELAVRSVPGDTDETVVEPLITAFMRPTVVVDPDATSAARERAAEEAGVEERIWRPGEAIVREGQILDAMQYRAVERLGLGGASPLRAFARTLLAMVLFTAVSAVYLQRMQPRVWRSGKKLLLLGLLVTVYAGLVVAAGVLTEATPSSGWSYAIPAGALGMLTALLVHPVVGLATMLPAALVVLLVSPGSAPVALFAALAVLISVPLTTRLSSRADLRSATLRAGLAYPVLALVVVIVFGPRDEWVTVLLAGVLNGVITALIVQGAMPFLENLFRLPTVTALLDLADRNHPLLRELEQKALGSYNHSVMVASLCERACRAIGADPLLGSVAALYHDIGKVRQPHFFIENQQGIGNPHDDLEPEVSAVIIQNHVADGVELATEYRLPPEVVACIGSHHGTMVVSYFYEQAVRAAGGDRDAVDEQHFRYKGGRPRSKEAAVLLLADCCEATTRAMAMSRGTLPREEIETTVDELLQERIDDHQFDDSDLTFRELQSARDVIVESLVGIYHPRIAYPGRDRQPPAARAADEPHPDASAEDPEPVDAPR